MPPRDVALANALKEAYVGGRFERVSFDVVAVPGTSRLSECRANAEAYVAQHGGKLVGVRHAIMPTIFNRHFIIETGSGLFDVTPRNSGDESLCYVLRHDEVSKEPISQFAAQLQADPF